MRISFDFELAQALLVVDDVDVFGLSFSWVESEDTVIVVIVPSNHLI